MIAAADQTAKERASEDIKADARSAAEPGGLHLSRRAVKTWGCHLMEREYEIVTQVGEGTFRYFL